MKSSKKSDYTFCYLQKLYGQLIRKKKKKKYPALKKGAVEYVENEKFQNYPQLLTLSTEFSTSISFVFPRGKKKGILPNVIIQKKKG